MSVTLLPSQYSPAYGYLLDSTIIGLRARARGRVSVTWGLSLLRLRPQDVVDGSWGHDAGTEGDVRRVKRETSASRTPAGGVPRHLFLMHEAVGDTVIDSQVLLPLDLLGRRGVTFDLVLFAALRESLREGRERRRARLTRARSALRPGRVHVFWTPSTRRRVGLLWSACMLGGMLIPDVLRRRVVVCHCRGLPAAAIARLVSRFLPRVRYLYDARGDALAEATQFPAPGRPSGSVRDDARTLLKQETQVVQHAAVVTCVSGPLKRRLMERHQGLCPRKMLVVPCAADEHRFGFDARLRGVERRRLGLDGLSVLVYAGALGPAWHGASDFMRLVSHALRADERRAFLCVTPDAAYAQRLAAATAVPDERCRIISASHGGVPGLMMAADIGLLVRPVSPVNDVACPTKLAEYLVSGLVLLYSPGIGDTEALVSKLGSGRPVPPGCDAMEFAKAFCEANDLVGDDASRAQRSRIAAESLSWERFLQVRADAYAYAAGLSRGTPSTAFYEDLIG